LLARLPRQVICLSRAMRDEFLELGVAADRLVVIRGGVDSRHFVPDNETGRSRVRAGWGVGPHDRLIGVLARLVPIKGVADLIHAAPIVLAEHPNARFIVVGDGPLAPGLRALASELGIAHRCLFTGRYGDVRDLLAALDTVVLPSFSEGMSNALMEAMATARAVVATNIPANAELVRDGETGLLVPPRCPEAFAQALCRLLADPARAAAMGTAGRRLIDEELNVYRRVEEELSLYETGEN
jgi:glycosyltransferase involved in cell wall biosynthesis